MKILFFDTETNGLPDYNKRARDPSQPHIVQLAAMLTDKFGTTLETLETIHKPTDWEITPELAAIHGITHEKALEIGTDEKEALEKLFAMIKQCDLMVAFNITFDKFIARIGLRRFEIFTDAEDAWWKAFPTFCTMRPMTNLCQLPHKSGGKGFKFPKLQEAYTFAMGKPFDGAHTAMADLEACKELYFWLKARG